MMRDGKMTIILMNVKIPLEKMSDNIN